MKTFTGWHVQPTGSVPTNAALKAVFTAGSAGTSAYERLAAQLAATPIVVVDKTPTSKVSVLDKEATDKAKQDEAALADKEKRSPVAVADMMKTVDVPIRISFP